MSPRPHVSSSFSLLLFLIFLIPSLHAQSGSPVSGDYKCTEHEPASTDKCLQRLKTHPKEYDPCKESVCYLFIEESPFIIFDSDAFLSDPDIQSPFPCGNPSAHHPSLNGLAFDLHNRTSSGDSLCIWAGPPDCSFNALVDFTAQQASSGYQFAITGLLLETPQRQCVHEPSAPLIDNRMVIIGQTDPNNASSRGPFYQLVKPFRWSTWAIFGVVVILFVFVCLAIAVRFHVVRGRSLVTAFFIFAGERDQAMAYEFDSVGHKDHNRATRTRSRWGRLFNNGTRAEQVEECRRSVSFATKYGLSMTLFRVSLLSFIAVFALFYEVAVVNFLFQQNSLAISKSVRNLSVRELKNYAVLQNSALANVWEATVNPRELPYDELPEGTVPWQECETGAKCIKMVADESNAVKFDVTFEVLGEFLVRENNFCDKLTIFETKDILYHFNAGWLYNNKCDTEFRRRVDREIIGLRVDGSIRRLIEERVGNESCSTSTQADIGPLIILVPCSLFVFPPLFAAILVLFFWPENKISSRDVPKDKVGNKFGLYNNHNQNAAQETFRDKAGAQEQTTTTNASSAEERGLASVV